MDSNRKNIERLGLELAMQVESYCKKFHLERLSLIVSEVRENSGKSCNSIKVIEDELPYARWLKQDASLGVTTGLMDLLNDNELKAVIGHEFKHHDLTNGRLAGASDKVMKMFYLSQAVALSSICANAFGLRNSINYYSCLISLAFSIGVFLHVQRANHKIEFECDKAGAEESSPKDMLVALKKIDERSSQVYAQYSQTWVYRTCRNLGSSLGEVCAAIRDTYDPCLNDKPACEVIKESALGIASAAVKVQKNFWGITSSFRMHPSNVSRFKRLVNMEAENVQSVSR